jgi:hypothetical protein
MNADDLIRQVKEQPRFRMEVGLLLDAVAFAEARELNELLQQARFGGDDDVTATGPDVIMERLVSLYRDTPEVRFTLEARSASEWEAIAQAHDGDDEAFTVALLAACIVSPEGFTEDGVRDLKGSLTVGQWQALVAGVRSVNEGLFDLRPTFAATVLMSGMRQKSTTVQDEASPVPSF